jgi:hypothetical protein
MKTSLKSMKCAAMTKATYPTKEVWLMETGGLLKAFEELNADDRNAGREIPEGRLDTVAEIQRTVEIYSKWTEEDFEAWRDALSPGEAGDEEHQANHPHLRQAPFRFV